MFIEILVSFLKPFCLRGRVDLVLHPILHRRLRNEFTLMHLRLFSFPTRRLSSIVLNSGELLSWLK
ncbi:hypothetical protein O9G_001805 [Rozella allomycis CSF55]|uniref:Uncharacterized protein n=1 Tax=Rozella allomycis (strain CSF55) TaxID=988480 RepID=A0A075B0Q2_ROZAC|nr:hypothetical protein O9G_001805 [Rozella allomycis CSF55]|eukprot:EPZ34549.1 hypothetical protein O9G_001805 [Rozella allomycis CSF55]